MHPCTTHKHRYQLYRPVPHPGRYKGRCAQLAWPGPGTPRPRHRPGTPHAAEGGRERGGVRRWFLSSSLPRPAPASGPAQHLPPQPAPGSPPPAALASAPAPPLADTARARLPQGAAKGGLCPPPRCRAPNGCSARLLRPRCSGEGAWPRGTVHEGAWFPFGPAPGRPGPAPVPVTSRRRRGRAHFLSGTAWTPRPRSPTPPAGCECGTGAPGDTRWWRVAAGPAAPRRAVAAGAGPGQACCAARAARRGRLVSRCRRRPRAGAAGSGCAWRRGWWRRDGPSLGPGALRRCGGLGSPGRLSVAVAVQPEHRASAFR